MAKPLLRKIAQQSLKRLQDNAIHAIKQKAASSGTRTASPYEVAKKALKDVWKSTFGQAENSGVRGGADPAFAYEYARLPRSYRPFHPAEYLKNHPSSRRHLSTGSSKYNKTPIGNTPLVASRLRPSINSSLRGPTLVSNVGIGSSRNFSSHGAGKIVSEIHRNVPVGMRALADKLRELEDDARKKKRTVTQFRVQKDKESHVCKALKKHEKSMGIKGSRWSVHASKAVAQVQQQRNAAEFETYFSSPQAGVVQASVSVPEQTMDTTSHINETTYLLIPLCPSLAHLVSGSVPPTIFDSDIPETPNLLHQLLPMHNAYDRHLRLRVTPLLLRLEGHGALDLSPEVWLTEEYRSRDGRVEVIFAPTEHGESRPDALRITFIGRSIEQVKRIIGIERLGHTDWVHLYSVPRVISERDWTPSSKQTSTEAPLRMLTFDRSGTAASANTIFDAEYPDHGIWSHGTASDVSDPTRPEISSLWLAEQSAWEEGSECSSPAWSDSEVELDLLSGSEISDGEEVMSAW
ncbi:hypothetical protein QFC22_000234 [Naganishia vaughanmartiniae]|uniref:Uncharacterized protein n=1 Tax=Naganishia vaughanmartiniae TaxID=1424756 RepID=A0ACC2XPH9_9TREE|nr:hypothetical protein QFC22_000234 [Naganishia vaughanmartiniae]